MDLTTGPSAGFFRGGAVPGWTFSDDDYDAFQAHTGLQFLSRALAKRERTRLEQRAILAARLLSTSTLEHDPDQKLLAAVMALEVLLGEDDDKDGPKKFRMARRYAFLACSVPSGSMCGRDRASCPYLALQPGDKAQRRELEALHGRGDSDVRVQCSTYLRAIGLYNAPIAQYTTAALASVSRKSGTACIPYIAGSCLGRIGGMRLTAMTSCPDSMKKSTTLSQNTPRVHSRQLNPP